MRFIKTNTDLVKKTKHLWLCTYLEEAQGHPGKWAIVWRSSEYHGKISAFYESKEKPNEREIARILEGELRRRFNSDLDEDAKRVAKLFFNEPLIAEISGCQKEIERMVTQRNDELIEALSEIVEKPIVNELFQRLKDLSNAQETMGFVDSFIKSRGQNV